MCASRQCRFVAARRFAAALHLSRRSFSVPVRAEIGMRNLFSRTLRMTVRNCSSDVAHDGTGAADRAEGQRCARCAGAPCRSMQNQTSSENCRGRKTDTAGFVVTSGFAGVGLARLRAACSCCYQSCFGLREVVRGKKCVGLCDVAIRTRTGDVRRGRNLPVHYEIPRGISASVNG